MMKPPSEFMKMLLEATKNNAKGAENDEGAEKDKGRSNGPRKRIEAR